MLCAHTGGSGHGVGFKHGVEEMHEAASLVGRGLQEGLLTPGHMLTRLHSCTTH